MNWNNIPQMTRPAHHRSQLAWAYLEEKLAHWDSKEIPGSLGVNLDPDFQRGHVWSEDRQIKFVEYVLRGGVHSQTLYFNHPNWMGSWKGEMVLVDGKQRLEAVRKFLRNELVIFGDQRYSDLMVGCKHIPDRYMFQVEINDLKTKPEILQWYLDLNWGGVSHTEEELNRVKELLKAEVK